MSWWLCKSIQNIVPMSEVYSSSLPGQWAVYSGASFSTKLEMEEDGSTVVGVHYVTNSAAGFFSAVNTIAVSSGDQVVTSFDAAFIPDVTAQAIFNYMRTPWGGVGYYVTSNGTMNIVSESSSAGAFVDSSFTGHIQKLRNGWFRLSMSFVAPSSGYILPLCMRSTLNADPASLSGWGNVISGFSPRRSSVIINSSRTKFTKPLPYAPTSTSGVNSDQFDGFEFYPSELSINKATAQAKSVTRSGKTFRAIWGTYDRMRIKIDDELPSSYGGISDYVNSAWAENETLVAASTERYTDVVSGKITNRTTPLRVLTQWGTDEIRCLGLSGIIELESF